MTELFRALNDNAVAGVAANPMLADPGASTRERAAELLEQTDPHEVPQAVLDRRARYRDLGVSTDAEAIARGAASWQQRIDEMSDTDATYNRCVAKLYGKNSPWGRAAELQVGTLEELERQQRINETAMHRVVGLVIETRPDAVTPQALTLIRRLGATKIQMGVQSLNQHILDLNERGIRLERIAQAFDLLRIFGFKIHAHAMANLLGATPEQDKLDYVRLVSEAAFQPDEIKLYPCALIEGARLCAKYEDGSWRPYTEDELLDVLADDVLATPAFTRISRMIRDFSSGDIKVGNKKPNLRQLVEQRLGQDQTAARRVEEIRYREIAGREVTLDELHLDVVSYETANTSERFLQWVDDENRIAGFLRLSLPSQEYVRKHSAELPVHLGEAMIREVHVYGKVAHLHAAGNGAQHMGLGRRLIERACEMAREAGYARINVISAIGTREYYRTQGFVDNGLYQTREL